MARIKHIAIRTPEVEKTAAFYKEAFGLEEVGMGQSGVYLSDGHINLAILKCEPPNEGASPKVGIDHLGFHVEDVDATLARVDKLGGRRLTDRLEVSRGDPSQPRSYFEIKCVGPDDQVIDISSAGWVGAD